MRVAVGALISRHYGNVWLRLRVVVERDRKLRVNLPGIAKGAAQRGQHPSDRRRVAAPLWLAARWHPAHKPPGPPRPEPPQHHQDPGPEARPTPASGWRGAPRH